MSSVQTAQSRVQPINGVSAPATGESSTVKGDLIAFAVAVLMATLALLVLREITSLMVQDLWQIGR